MNGPLSHTKYDNFVFIMREVLFICTKYIYIVTSIEKKSNIFKFLNKFEVYLWVTRVYFFTDFIPALRANDTDETDNGTNSNDEAEKIDPLTGSIIPAERNLSRDLFNHGYDKTVRPAKTAKDIVNITMDLL